MMAMAYVAKRSQYSYQDIKWNFQNFYLLVNIAVNLCYDNNEVIKMSGNITYNICIDKQVWVDILHKAWGCRCPLR